MDSRVNLEKMASLLVDSGDYKVLRRLDPRHLIIGEDLPVGDKCRRGLFVDVETTGLDVERDEIIEIGMVSFDYDPVSATVVRLGEVLVQNNEPSQPLSDEVKRVTGITDEMLKGKRFDMEEIERIASSANLVMAHNAAFDRRLLERQSAVFRSKPWACTMIDVEWAREGIGNLRQENIAQHFGYFYDSHRAGSDCMAGVGLLCLPLPTQDNKPALSRLLANARQCCFYVEASNAPFDLKDFLKERGYFWHAGDRKLAKHWWLKVPEDDIDEEMEWLSSNIYKRSVDHIRVRKITPYEKYSERETLNFTTWGEVKQQSLSFSSGP